MRTLLVVAVAAVLSFVSSAEAQTVSCESFGPTSYRECRIGSSGVIRLVTEYSANLCVEDVTWGSNQIGVVWVRRGCRATFTVTETEQSRERRLHRVICESKNGRREVCEADLADGIVLVQQLSKARCAHGQSWGYDLEKAQIWVDQGCRAEFRRGRGPDAIPGEIELNTPVTCESKNGKRNVCKADTSAGVQIVRQLDNASCDYRRDWGWDNDGIWVANRCRAEFVVRGKPKVAVQAIACESVNGMRNRCPADTHLGVAVFKTLGDGECIFGETWGFDADGVWVDKGCYAQFALGGYRLPADAVLPPNAEKITCESLDGGHKPCPVDTSRGVGLLRQLSDADCVLNRTWGYDRNGIWVTNGCRADFAVAH